MFPYKDVRYYELNSKNIPTRPAFIPQHYYLVKQGSGQKVAVSFKSLLAKDIYIADKQSFLMDIMLIERDIEKAKHIYYNWDWCEFLIYQQSLLSARIL